MNPLLNQNLFMLRTIHAQKSHLEKFVVVNEFEDFSGIVEDEMAIKIYSFKEKNRKERVYYARDMLISLIGPKRIFAFENYIQ